MKIQPVKGTKDFYPEEKALQNYIFNIWRSISLQYGFEEVDTPVLEPTEIYKKSGEEIPEQTYQLQDKSGRKLVLRPELTPTIARMITQRKDLSKPIKWFSLPRCFRYEAPQAGRAREFNQFNIDCLGSESMLMDAEIIATSIEIMKAFGLTSKDFYVRISNRKLLQSFLISLGGVNVKNISRLIDKKDKIGEETFILSLKDLNLSQDKIKYLLSFLKIKNIEDLKPYLPDLIGKQGLNEISQLFSYLKQFNLLQYCKLDLSITRGIDYYTSTVFEVFDAEGEFRAIAGGGRYDDLAGIPGVGYAMGDIVLGLFLKKKNKLVIKKESKIYIIYIGNKALKTAFLIAEKLRKSNIVEMDVMDKGLGKQLAYANQNDFSFAVIIGEDEIKKGKYKLKDMKTGKEKLLTINQLENFFE